MRRLAILAIGIAIVGIAPADAAPRQKKVRAPAAQSTPVMQPAVARRPLWAAPQQCFTDEGYGRFVPCDVGDAR